MAIVNLKDKDGDGYALRPDVEWDGTPYLEVTADGTAWFLAFDVATATELRDALSKWIAEAHTRSRGDE